MNPNLNDGTAITIKIKQGITVHKISIKVLCDVFDGIGFFEALNLIAEYKSKKSTKTDIATIIGSNMRSCR